MKRCLLAVIVSSLLTVMGVAAEPAEPDDSRRPTSDADLKYWLENMVWHHNFTKAEVSAATGLSEKKVTAALKLFKIRTDLVPPDDITPDSLKQAMERLDPLQKARISILPRCLQVRGACAAAS